MYYEQGYHRTTPENKHAAVRLPKRQKLFIVKPQKVVEDQQNKGLHVHRVPFFRQKSVKTKTRSSLSQNPVFPLKIGENQNKKKGLHVRRMYFFRQNFKNKHGTQK